MNVNGYYNQVNTLSGYEEVVATSMDIPYIGNNQEVHQDLQVNRIKATSISGQLRDYNNRPIKGECVKLVRQYDYEGRQFLEIMDVTRTDELGCYQLECYEDNLDNYNLLIGDQGVNLKPSCPKMPILMNDRPVNSMINTHSKCAQIESDKRTTTHVCNQRQVELQSRCLFDKIGTQGGQYLTFYGDNRMTYPK